MNSNNKDKPKSSDLNLLKSKGVKFALIALGVVLSLMVSFFTLINVYKKVTNGFDKSREYETPAGVGTSINKTNKVQSNTNKKSEISVTKN